MPSRRKRKAWRKRCGQTAEATAGAKSPEICPPDDHRAGALGAEVDRQRETSLFQSKREFYADSLLLRQSIRENWPVPVEQREAIPVVLTDAVLRTASDAPPDAEFPDKYHWKTGHRLAAIRLMVKMTEVNSSLVQSDASGRFRGEITVQESTRMLEDARRTGRLVIDDEAIAEVIAAHACPGENGKAANPEPSPLHPAQARAGPSQAGEELT